ncbi:MAG: type II secretion system major pseudopilin GspG [Chthoniobacterales bacterium]|nr:type II secretion system major pseudopilin GspG [Chthoniobacterales bacterium]
MKPKSSKGAFTLLEIMLVVMIIGLLLGTAIYKLKGNVEVSRGVAVDSSLQSIRTQLKLYESLNGFPPTTEQGLGALVAQPQNEPRPARWTQLLDGVPKDPWGKEFVYISPGRKNPNAYDLYSAGPDRTPDTADDLWGGG